MDIFWKKHTFFCKIKHVHSACNISQNCVSLINVLNLMKIDDKDLQIVAVLI